MSVDFTNRVVAGLRARGVTVHFWSGWERRGNGQASAYQGPIWHHTASNYGSAYATLVTGRAGLSGPLCNSSGNADGSITIIAAHPANHAGASGGRSMGPLPTTRSFNSRVWGHEIVYPGTKPMTDAQYRSATILGAVVSEILGRPNAEWCRGHAETSVTGKWDPGYAMDRTYDLVRMRADTVAVMRSTAPVPAPTPAPKKKGLPKMIERSLKHGKNYHRIACPVGSASGLVKRAWISITAIGGGTITVAFQKNLASDGPPPGAGVVWGPGGARIRNASRVYEEIPSGTEFLEVWVDVFGKDEGDPDGECGSVLIELEPKV